ncbi:hypothetical protein ARMSODRAFT_509241 [Armillaria solidipes]|uniref:C2H2-type domain-containing protein n=1 Tax=Armillaria solidipes TaxID=1076256 RepID=A0A2H3CGA1_9AGAR|nr:hypothetical protein ARMSODRAFT_509241 [Armillaria solidipes]
MSDPSRATDANDPSAPNDIQTFMWSPNETIESSDLWNDSYDGSATASDYTTLDQFDSYNNHASLLAPLPDLATDYAVDYYTPDFLDHTEETAGYGVMSSEAMANYSPYYYATEPSFSLPTPDTQLATQLESGDASTGNDYPVYDGPLPPTQLESYDCHPDQTDAPKARRNRKKGRRPRPRPANEESRPPMSPPVELGEPGPSTQRANPRNSRASLKRKSDPTPPPEFDRSDKRRRMNADRDAARIRLESREDEPGRMASRDSLGYESLREEETPVRPRRIRPPLSKRQQWDEASYHGDDNSSTRSPGPGEPGPSTWAHNSEQEFVPSPRNIDSHRSRVNMPARTSHRRKSKNSRRFRCPHCGLGNSREARTFHRANDLRRHLTYHTAHKSDDCDKTRLECPDCHKIFSRPDSLIRHRGNPTACARNIA